MDRCEIEVHYAYVWFHTYRKKNGRFRRSFFPSSPLHLDRGRGRKMIIRDGLEELGGLPGGVPSDWKDRRGRGPKARKLRFKLYRLQTGHAIDRRLTKLGNNRGQSPVNICGRSDLGRKRERGLAPFRKFANAIQAEKADTQAQTSRETQTIRRDGEHIQLFFTHPPSQDRGGGAEHPHL